jgi:hypothetical protein
MWYIHALALGKKLIWGAGDNSSTSECVWRELSRSRLLLRRPDIPKPYCSGDCEFSDTPQPTNTSKFRWNFKLEVEPPDIQVGIAPDRALM